MKNLQDILREQSFLQIMQKYFAQNFLCENKWYIISFDKENFTNFGVLLKS